MIKINELKKDAVFVSPVIQTTYTVSYEENNNIIFRAKNPTVARETERRISKVGALIFLNSHKYAAVE